MNKNLRIGIITSSAKIRENIHQVVSDIPWTEVAWILDAENISINDIEKNKPDLVLVGAFDENDQTVATTELIINHSPLPILLLCDSVPKHASIIFEAMGKGAIDVIDIPGIYDQITQDEINNICLKLKTVSKLIDANSQSGLDHRKNREHVYNFPLIVIGSSTGGPAALAELLSKFPLNTQAAIVVVQHIDDKFTENLVQWLDTQIAMPVEIAEDGQNLLPGKVFLAAGHGHLTLTDDSRLVYTQHPENSAYKPCIDVFFFSVAEHWHGYGIAVLLTGMGADGAGGLLELRQSGFITMTQDEDSCAVFGMPAAAIKIDAAKHIDSPENIANFIIRKLEIKNVKATGT